MENEINIVDLFCGCDDFVLTGNKTEQTKQVGNSVPAETAAALCRKMLEYCMKGK